MLLRASLTNEFSLAELEPAIAQWERLQFADPLFVAPDDVPKTDWWQITHASSDASHAATKKVITRANEILEAAPKGAITEAIENGDVAGALALFDWRAYENSLSTGLADVFQKIGVRSGADTAIEIGKGVDYDESNFIRESIRGARIVAARITKSTRRATSDALRRLMNSGTMSAGQLRLQIFSLLGLDPVQANAGVNKIIAQREAGTSLKKVREATDKFAKKARAVREERIARFENLNAAQMAQEDAVAQHVDVRALKNVVKVWVVVPDDSLCPICNRLRNQRQIEGDSFTDPLTGLTYVGPPAHQACRCGLRYLEARKDPRAVGVFVVDIRVPEDDGPVTLARQELAARIFHAQHDQSTHGRKGPRSKGGGAAGEPQTLEWRAPPAPRGKPGGKAGGFSSTGLTNTEVGDTAEAALSQLGFESALPAGKRQGPFDVKCCGDMEFEVKALTTDSAEYKIKMKKKELDGKKASAKKRGIRPGSIMVVMDYRKGEAHAYWREGLGNFRLSEKTWNYMGTATVGGAEAEAA